MTRISAEIYRPGAMAFSGLIGREVDRDPDTSVAKLAVKLNVPEESLRNYVAGKTSPNFDRLLRMSRRMPDAMLLDVLQTLAGTRAVVSLAEAPDPARARDQAESLRALVVDVQRQAVEVQAELNGALADGRIDADESGRLSVRGGMLARLSARFVNGVQRFAAGRSGR